MLRYGCVEWYGKTRSKMNTYRAKWQKDNRTTWTCRQADNRHETTQKKKSRKTEDKVLDVMNRDVKLVGLERKMADDRRRWTIDDNCGDPRWRDRLKKRRRLYTIFFHLCHLPLIIASSSCNCFASQWNMNIHAHTCAYVFWAALISAHTFFVAIMRFLVMLDNNNNTFIYTHK